MGVDELVISAVSGLYSVCDMCVAGGYSHGMQRADELVRLLHPFGRKMRAEGAVC